jgi:transcriptional regulator with XRE-family HTH domain
MNRFEQRMRKRLQNPEVAAGFREMAAERALLQCLDEIREQQHITKEELASRMGKHREAVSRLLNASDANPTLETFIELLMALGITAEITLRPATEGEEPIKVARAG